MLYTGAMEKGQMHGKGALVYPNGEKYEGDFQHGKRHGYGVYSYADGGRFEGEWVDDKVHGRGVSVYSSGNRCARRRIFSSFPARAAAARAERQFGRARAETFADRPRAPLALQLRGRVGRRQDQRPGHAVVRGW